MRQSAQCELPDPDQREDSDVVIYDDQCRLCRTTARWLHQLDTRERTSYLPLQDDRVPRRYPDLSREELEKHVYVVDHHEQRHSGAHAVRYLSRRIPGLWLLAPALHIPGSMPLWSFLYRQVSRRRHLFNRR